MNKLLSGIKDIIDSNKLNYWNGKFGKMFEETFAEYVGVKYCVAVNSGSMALEIAIKSLNLKPQSKIIVPSKSYIATASSVLRCGHIPVFADVDINGNISMASVNEIIDKEVKAIIIVHLGGVPVDVKDFKYSGVKIIEDCSQAHGSRINGKVVGSFGDIAVWSFCHNKVITTMGEGGMIGTNYKKYFDFCWSLKEVGKNINKLGKKLIHENIGTNARMTEVQAFFGLHQLNNLSNLIETRNKIVKTYKSLLDNTEINFPIVGSEKIVSYQKLNLISCYRDKYLKLPFVSLGNTAELYKEPIFKKQKPLFMAKYLSESGFTISLSSNTLRKEIEENCRKIIKCKKS